MAKKNNNHPETANNLRKKAQRKFQQFMKETMNDFLTGVGSSYDSVPDLLGRFWVELKAHTYWQHVPWGEIHLEIDEVEKKRELQDIETSYLEGITPEKQERARQLLEELHGLKQDPVRTITTFSERLQATAKEFLARHSKEIHQGNYTQEDLLDLFFSEESTTDEEVRKWVPPRFEETIEADHVVIEYRDEQLAQVFGHFTEDEAHAFATEQENHWSMTAPEQSTEHREWAVERVSPLAAYPQTRKTEDEADQD